MPSTRFRISALALSAGLIAAACGSSESTGGVADGSSESTGGVADGSLDGIINISGSSTVEPVSQRVAELFFDIVRLDVVRGLNGGNWDVFLEARYSFRPWL